MVAPGGVGGGHVWLLPGGMCMVAPGGSMCGCSRGGAGMCGCSRGGHAWLLPGGACMVAPGGACMVAPRGACMVAPGGACVVAPGGGHAWLLPGGACVVAPGGACVVAPEGGGVRGFFDEIRSMSGRYASYWNAFLLLISFHVSIVSLELFFSVLSNSVSIKSSFLMGDYLSIHEILLNFSTVRLGITVLWSKEGLDNIFSVAEFNVLDILCFHSGTSGF